MLLLLGSMALSIMKSVQVWPAKSGILLGLDLCSWLLPVWVLGHINVAILLGVTQPLSVADYMGIWPLIADLQPAGPLYPAGQGFGPPVPLPSPGHQQCGRKSPPRKWLVRVK